MADEEYDSGGVSSNSKGVSSDSEGVSSDSSSSSGDEEIIQDIPDDEFLEVLSCLKRKDPKIYDKKVHFFSEPSVGIKKSAESSSKLNKNNIIPTIKEESDSEDDLTCFNIVPKKNDDNKSTKGIKTEITDQETESKHLNDCWDEKELDANEQFLKDYILRKKYLDTDEKVTTENEDLSEDEKEIEKQAEYEANYNFRFENEDNLKIKRFPRNVEGSMRRKNDARSKKRAEIAQRKKEEKEKKHKEIKKKQKQKLSEIEERLKNLKELTGNVELGFKDEEILEDFDPEKHDQKMKELFNDDYYNKQDEEYPECNNDDYWDDNINMDCDAVDDEGKSQKKLTRTQKKRLRKKKSYKDIMDIAKPAFDANVHSDFKKYIDEYYSLDCEDFIDDIPCKFKYREVVPNDYGLTVEEILMADDKELNRWVSAKKISSRRPEHVEKNEVYIYKKKGQDEELKRKLLPSLFVEPEELNDSQDKLSDNSPETTSKSKKRKRNENNMEESKENSNDKSFIASEEFSENNDEVNSKKHKKKKSKNTHEPGTSSNPEESKNYTSDNEGVTGGIVTTENKNAEQNGEKKKKRKKRKKNKNKTGESTISPNKTNTGQPVNEANRKSSIGDKVMNQQGGQKKFKSNKFNNRRFDFKKKKNDVVNLSDNRLQAYGIKPKQFRSKLMYSQKN